ncbi:MAG: hypothetical protein LBT36_02885, partial [Oscillospiraceae bacterium]|nr:hypothetical protein [Oscillospiraceae bacterium]
MVRYALICALIVVALEIFVFNLRSFAAMLVPGAPITSENALFEGFYHDADADVYIPAAPDAFVLFPSVNAPVATLHIDVRFTGETKTQSYRVEYGDEESIFRATPEFTVVRGYAPSQYVTLGVMGGAQYIRLVAVNPAADAAIRAVTLNAPIPLRLNVIRMSLLLGLALAAYGFRTRGWGAVLFDPSSKTQRKINGALLALLVGSVVFTTTLCFPWEESFTRTLGNVTRLTPDQYNTDIVDALLGGRVYLNREPSDALIAAERPYDPAYRSAHGVSVHWDTAYYNGKYYSYYGIVPVLLSFLPFTLATGGHLPTQLAVMSYLVGAAFFLYFLWRQIVLRYLEKMPYILYLLGAAALFYGAQTMYLLMPAAFYQVPLACGLMLVSLGLWLALKSDAAEKRSEERR